MTPEQGYHLAKFQRPGVVIVMGPLEAREKRTAPIHWCDYLGLPGERSLEEYALRRWPDLITFSMAVLAAEIAEKLGHAVTDAEWRWLHGPASRKATYEWIKSIRIGAKDGKRPRV